MNDENAIFWVHGTIIAVVISLSCAFIYWSAANEARVFNACKGTSITTWDALFVELMVEDCVERVK